MDLAKTLVRTISRAFYSTEHILIIDALAIHSTLTDADLAHLLGIQPKALRRLSAKLKEDGLISVQARGEKKEGAPPSYHVQNGTAQVKERLFFRDWYYINFHRAIDSIKYRLWKLNRHVESLGAPSEERKELVCPRCKSTYTELEVMDNIAGDGFHCHRCDHVLEPQEEGEGPAENESMKRMNDQLARVLALMRQIDATTVPENDFDAALQHYIPIERPDSHPGARNIVVEDRKQHIASSKGLAVAPEKVSVNLTEEKVEEASAEQKRADREREAKQNLLPEWISRSTLSGDLTAVGAREVADRRRRDLEHGGGGSTAPLVDLGGGTDSGTEGAGGAGEEKKTREIIDNAAMDEYWRELKAAQEKERRGMEMDEEEDDDDEDDDEDDVDGFEDVDGLPAKRVKLDGDGPNGVEVKKEAAQTSGLGGEVGGRDDGKVSDADDDDDDDEFEFEDV